MSVYRHFRRAGIACRLGVNVYHRGGVMQCMTYDVSITAVCRVMSVGQALPAVWVLMFTGGAASCNA
ncbi:hypothetical protein [Aliidiomarina quisquiliarum]|uniref:hypothetical protein n=1 Tax=Aliidiomarina quisquiliarum TaxID=2938947 RepID=UPI00208F0A5A|nr:hypothetical protein [Aliidiomarina quisquiliarum]MCO4322447.1 hypothetical protein [Aliidiomarina quisquiliarum]